jgi:uncharacterized protein YciI
MHFILFYDTADDYITRRAPLRSAHLGLAKEAFARGDLVLAGALADPPDMAVLVFRTDEAARAFAAKDPYVLNGAVKSWRVRQWTTVLGDGAEPPNV